ncbi:origin recognition complex subunit 5 C-terminus-domain-containing protein [Staphylotrichum tortipilum]|uniref:Origin recognition complex subunit 5 C-terminus-domain-containing protein n=1 Tax=Staphylotrichum tortipilum TaxID=2831512 RepID=A0AAN6MLY7_9PEZI|nr:origin recognition complex subunit 5 C-terminus-domain-containing protein [Staphylotrichum longicolle]
MTGLFQLPDELIFTTLTQAFPCREPQIRALATLLYPRAAPCRNLVVYGTEATGKAAITTALLAKLADHPHADDHDDDFSLRYAIVNSVECITARHLYETVVAKTARALAWDAAPSRCETLSQLAVELSKMLKYAPRPDGFRFVLVLDAIDRQRDAPNTMFPALARLSEIIPSLTTVFIVTSPPPHFLLTPSVPHLHFPSYTKPDFVTILSLTPPSPLPNTTPQETADLYSRFAAAVHDALARAASRTLPSLSHACAALWPRFTAPVRAGTHTAREFSKLLVAARAHFHDDTLLDPGVLAPTTITTTAAPTTSTILPKPDTATSAGAALAHLLPTTPRLLLLASYLASHNPTRHDVTLFSTHHQRTRRRRGGGGSTPGRRPKHRKIARKLLGAHAFVLERMLAIYASVRGEWMNSKSYCSEEEGVVGDADIGMAMATLASLRLLVKVGGAGGAGGGSAAADVMDCGGKWRVNVGWEVIRGLGRGVGVEVEEWLIE